MRGVGVPGVVSLTDLYRAYADEYFGRARPRANAGIFVQMAQPRLAAAVRAALFDAAPQPIEQPASSATTVKRQVRS
jgi:hypothetical protein